jgi:ABC-type antimicrobial peptide transport system permease subunit
MNVLLASVAERTREIGIRKAVGARRSDIKTQFLAESVAIAVAGTGIGLVFGLLLAAVVTAVFRQLVGAPVYPVLAPSTVLLAVLSSSGIGLLFGTYPARRAANLAPIEAIAHE